ncbi:MAG: Transposase DDE domain protein [Alphaproteobacteria bacterium ADurb.BinA305]|nr:MAG: Transposase DDE domain protein [Alphaproteobacteria bacterium ADurb.BinA305]
MRGGEERQAGFIVMTTLEDVVPGNHPLRAIRALVDRALEEMSPELEALYAAGGRPSIAPEYLLRAQLVQILYAIPSERRLCEQLRYNLLLRWFVGLPMDEPVWHPTSFTKNRERLLTAAIAAAFFSAIRSQAEAHKLLSREHFSVDGTLIEAWASHKSFKPKDADKDDDAGHSLTENRNGLIVDCELTEANGSCEREAGLRLLARQRRRSGRARMSVGADRGYDTRGFVADVRELGVTPHVAAKDRFSAVDGRTTRHAGYATSQRRRKLVEEPFGWMKTVGGLHKLRHRGKVKAAAIFTFACAAYNLVRLRTLLAEPSPA